LAVGQTGGAIERGLEEGAPSLHALGFRGSSQNYRKQEGDFIFVINFQGSRSGDNSYVNLGAHAEIRWQEPLLCHRHFGGKECHYAFSTPEKLIADFQRDIARWNNENSHA